MYHSAFPLAWLLTDIAEAVGMEMEDGEEYEEEEEEDLGMDVDDVHK